MLLPHNSLHEFRTVQLIGDKMESTQRKETVSGSRCRSVSGDSCSSQTEVMGLVCMQLFVAHLLAQIYMYIMFQPYVDVSEA